MSTGNHDITLDEAFYAENGANFHSQYPENHKDCLSIIQGAKSITYLNHESKTIRLNKSEGPHTEFKVFGSPYSPAKGNWAFQYAPERARDLWDQIPLDTDVLITHTPPRLHGDESKNKEPAGCEVLREALWRVRPQLSICGHVHEGRGSDLVTWDLDCPNIAFKEKFKTTWVDPSVGTKKQALLDLTAKGGVPIDWSCGQEGGKELGEPSAFSAGNSPSKLKVEVMASPASSISDPTKKASIARKSSLSALLSRSGSTKSIRGVNQILRDAEGTETSEAGDTVVKAGAAIRGRGGSPSSGRSDREALVGRLGRKQTCVINAAIMATSWPYKGYGSERYNKPIVVDVDLPVWSGDVDQE